MALDERALITSCQGGNLADFDPLYQQYITPIYRFIYHRTMERQLAEDLTSQTFMKALEKIRLYSASKGPFVAWLYSIARNTVTDHFRSFKHSTDIETVWDLSSADDPHRETDTQIGFEQLKKALSGLDKTKRDIILLRLWDNLSYKEIAAITGKSEGNCKVIFVRTLEVLRKELHPAAFLLLTVLFPHFL